MSFHALRPQRSMKGFLVIRYALNNEVECLLI